MTMSMSVSGDRFQKTAPVAQVIREGRERLMARSWSQWTRGSRAMLPMCSGFGMTFDVVGRPKTITPYTGGAGFFSTSWSYFRRSKSPLLRGRAFTEQDNAAAPGVAIINEAMARQYWPKGDPLADRIQIGPGPALRLLRDRARLSASLAILTIVGPTAIRPP